MTGAEHSDAVGDNTRDIQNNRQLLLQDLFLT